MAKAKMFLFRNAASNGFYTRWKLFPRNVSTHYEATNFHSLKRVIIFEKRSIVNGQIENSRQVQRIFIYLVYSIIEHFLKLEIKRLRNFFKHVSYMKNLDCIWNQVIK